MRIENRFDELCEFKLLYHYAGYMDHDIIVLLDHSNRTFTLKLKTSTSYNDFKSKLDDNGLNPNIVTNLSFSIPEHSNCVMANDEH